MRNCTRVNCPCGFFDKNWVNNCKLHQADMEICSLRKHVCPSPVIPADSLSENGILFKVNHDILHPIGMALTTEGEHLYVADFTRGGIYFDEKTIRLKEDAFARYKEGEEEDE